MALPVASSADVSLCSDGRRGGPVERLHQPLGTELGDELVDGAPARTARADVAKRRGHGAETGAAEPRGLSRRERAERAPSEDGAG